MILSLLLSLCITTVSFSQTNLVVNGDFELGSVPLHLPGIKAAIGWNDHGGVPAGFGQFTKPILCDARSTWPLGGVPSNFGHNNLYDFKVAQGNQRYVLLVSQIQSNVEVHRDIATGALLQKLDKGCYTFNIKACKESTNKIQTLFVNGNILHVKLISSTHPNMSKDIYHPIDSPEISLPAAVRDSINWVTRTADFNISQSEAGIYDSISIKITNAYLSSWGSNRTNAMFIDEVEIYSKFEVGVNIPSTIRICKGSELVITPDFDYYGQTTTNLTATWTKSPLPWNHYANSNPNFTLRDYPLQNTTYTIQANDGTCAGTTTVEVIVEDLTEAELNGSFTECDLDGQITYQLLNNIDGVNVSWVVSGGTLQLPPINNPNFAQVVWIPNFNGPKYIVVNQNAWSCSRSDTLFIRPCCQKDYSSTEPVPVLDVLRLVNTKHSAEFQQVEITNLDVANIEINGTYEVDDQATYRGINFVMGPGSKLLVTSINVLFENCTFLACGDEMWYGIEPNLAHVEFDNCIIKESQKGISVIESFSRVTINSCLFEKNYTSINVTNRDHPQASAANSWLSITNSQFYGNRGVALLKPYDQTITHAGLSTPRNSHAAINLMNALGVKIGDLNNSSNVNSFTDLNNGIVGRFSQVEVYHANFENIATNELYAYAPHPAADGAAVRLNNVNTPYFDRDERSRVINCTITNSQYGVEGLFTDSLRVENCTFTQVNQGIRVTNDFGKPSIKNNSMTINGPRGIMVHSTFNPIWISNFYASIVNNHITTSTTGIDVISQRSFIDGNTVVLVYNAPGTNFTGIRVRNLTTTIHVTNQVYPSVIRNHIYSQNGVPPQSDLVAYPIMQRWNRGISIEHCGYLIVAENFIENTVTGVVTEGVTMPNVQIKCNTFQGPYIGINRVNNMINTQGNATIPADNRWVGIRAVDARVWQSVNMPSLPLTYYHRGNTNDISNVYSPAPFTGPINAIDQINLLNRCNYLITGDEEPDAGEQNYFDLSTAEAVALGDINLDDLAATQAQYQEYFSEFNVLRAIMADSTLLASSILDDFYGQLYAQVRGQLNEAHIHLLSGNLSEYASIKSNVLSQGIYDSLQLLVADIYARTWAIPATEVIPFNSVDYQNLLQIAHMDVVDGGEATYTARVMLGIDPLPTTMHLRTHNQDALKFVEADALKVFPNPAQRDLKIELSAGTIENASFEIFDLQGKSVSKGHLGTLDGYGHIPLNAVANGMYLLRISTDTNVYQSKFVVNKP